MRRVTARLLGNPLVRAGLRWMFHVMIRLRLASLAVWAQGILGNVVAEPIVITTPDGRSLQGSVDHLRELSTAASGDYEAGTVTLFRASIHPGARVLDLGANIGVFTTLAAREVGPGGQVLAVEPDERNLRHLRANVDRLGLGNVEIVPGAVADLTGSASLHQAASPTRSTLYAGFLTKRPSGGVVEVPTITVDDLLAGRAVDVIKMDIEGAESAALDGMSRTLASNPDLVMFLEFEEGSLRAVGSSPEALVARLRARFAQVLVVDEKERALVDPDRWRMHVWQNLVCAPSSFIASVESLSWARQTTADDQPTPRRPHRNLPKPF
jgi:FkbM family methyltransferase